MIQANLDFDMVALDDALNCLSQFDPGKERIVELRYFAGLSVVETAQLVGRSPATGKREWAMAKGWLYRRLNGEDEAPMPTYLPVKQGSRFGDPHYLKTTRRTLEGYPRQVLHLASDLVGLGAVVCPR